MNEAGAFLATMIDASRKAFAAGAVLRLQETNDECAKFVSSWGFNALVENVQQRLEHLSEALACGRPELFAMDAHWLVTAHEAREVPPQFFQAELSCLLDELEENLPADDASTVKEYMAAALNGTGQSQTGSEINGISMNRPHGELLQLFTAALLEGDRGKAEQIALDAMDEGLGFGDLHHHIISPAQAEVGAMWQRGEVHVAEEHLSSRIVEDVLAYVRARLPKAEQNGHSVLISSVSGNLHDIGARIVANHFDFEGWRTIFLGANTPREDLVRALADFTPDLVALSAGLAINMRATAATIEALRAADPNVPILVGGRPFSIIDGLWKDLGADGYVACAEQAVREAQRLIASVKSA